jgi:hypothetical protein
MYAPELFSVEPGYASGRRSDVERRNHIHIADNRILTTTIFAPPYERRANSSGKKLQPTTLASMHSAWRSTLTRHDGSILAISITTKPAGSSSKINGN